MQGYRIPHEVFFNTKFNSLELHLTVEFSN